MINDKKLKQEGGDNSTNLQGQNVVINNGITYADARDIATDVFRSNFIQLSTEAAEVAKQRAEHLVDEFLKKIETEKPEALQKISDPDMQYALFTAQKEFARSGEKEMESMLVSILSERIEEDSQSFKKIVLNEALEIVPKLTKQQLDTLTIVFIIQETIHRGIVDKEKLTNYLNSMFLPFISNLTKEKSCYKHLEYTGCCGTIGIPDDKLAKFFLNNYRGLFSTGFEREKYEPIIQDNEALKPLFFECMNNESLFQVNALNYEDLKDKIIHLIGDSDDTYNKIKALFDSSSMNVSEVEKYLIDILPEMKELIDVWRESDMCVMNPTSVGTTLAYINLKRNGININLDVWIK